MPAVVTQWTPERRAALESALRESPTVKEAAVRLGMTEAKVRGAFKAFPDLDYHALLKRAEPVAVAPPPGGVVVSGDAPAWQGYKPRAGWQAPERSKPAPEVPAEVITSIKMTDIHCPYQSRRDVECALGIIREVQPDELDLLGDIMDLESLSRHPKSRPDLAKLSEEHYATNLLLDDIQNAHQGRKTRYLQGNHEARAERFEAEYGQLDGVLSVPQSLYIQPRSEYHREASSLRGIEWVPLRMQPFTVRNTALLHGVFESQYHAYMNAMHVGPRSGVRYLFSGHMHGWQSFTSPAGCTAFSLPWLGDERRHVFQSYVKGRPRPWNVGVVIVEECGDIATVTPVFISNGRALFSGHVVQAA